MSHTEIWSTRIRAQYKHNEDPLETILLYRVLNFCHFFLPFYIVLLYCYVYSYLQLLFCPFSSLILPQVKWKDWPSFRTLMVTGLRSWVPTIWCPLPPKNLWRHATCCSAYRPSLLWLHWERRTLGFSEEFSNVRWRAEGKWSGITCTMAISVPGHGLD